MCFLVVSSIQWMTPILLRNMLWNDKPSVSHWKFWKQEQLPLSSSTKPNYPKRNIEKHKQGQTCFSCRRMSYGGRRDILLIEECTLSFKGTVYILIDIKILHLYRTYKPLFNSNNQSCRINSLSSFWIATLSQRE